MTKYFIIGKVYYQEISGYVEELLGSADTEEEVSKRICELKNFTFPPKDIFVIEGTKMKVQISAVKTSKEN